MEKIYINGDFLTLEEDNIEAIYIKDNRIKKVGTKKDILNLKSNETEIVDLNGKTIMPSFVDSHSHFFAVANNLLQVSLEGAKNINEIQEKLLKYKEENNIEKGKWILANGYDNNILEEKRHINKQEIDKILPDNPVVIQHKSGHNGIFNSMGLKLLNITENTQSPEGGKIEKINGKLTGFLEENAFIENIKKVPMPEIEDLVKMVGKAEKKYASYGITTVQEGMFTKELIPIYKKIVNDNKLTLDVIAFMDVKAKNEIEYSFSKNIRRYKNRFKIRGIKIFLDGSPQARTAWMRTPYIDDENHFGYSTMSDKQVKEALTLAYKENLQILAHCNGDMAAQQYINCIKDIEGNIEKLRPVLIHGQLLGIDQLKEIKKLGIIPSYFISHIYYWGDIHIKNFGIERADKISPAGSSIKNNIIFTFHQDSPVIEPNMLETIWCAVNRKTKNGILLGKEEKIEVINAIKALTINAAYQYSEENEKGSIKEGKLADLIILDKNPIKVEKEKIKEIKILETIKEGKTIYKYE